MELISQDVCKAMTVNGIQRRCKMSPQAGFDFQRQRRFLSFWRRLVQLTLRWGLFPSTRSCRDASPPLPKAKSPFRSKRAICVRVTPLFNDWRPPMISLPKGRFGFPMTPILSILSYFFLMPAASIHHQSAHGSCIFCAGLCLLTFFSRFCLPWRLSRASFL